MVAVHSNVTHSTLLSHFIHTSLDAQRNHQLPGVRTAAWLTKHNQSLRIFHLLSSNKLLHNLILCKLILQTRSPVTGPYAVDLQRPHCICSRSRSQDFERGTSISTDCKMTFVFRKIHEKGNKFHLASHPVSLSL